jgi:hypothetical protein
MRPCAREMRMDFDPRDFDSRDDERNRGHDDDGRDDHNDGLAAGDSHRRDRGGDARSPGRGPGDSKQSNSNGHDSRDDGRWPERHRGAPERNFDPRESFTRHLQLRSRRSTTAALAPEICAQMFGRQDSIPPVRRALRSPRAYPRVGRRSSCLFSGSVGARQGCP